MKICNSLYKQIKISPWCRVPVKFSKSVFFEESHSFIQVSIFHLHLFLLLASFLASVLFKYFIAYFIHLGCSFYLRRLPGDFQFNLFFTVVFSLRSAEILHTLYSLFFYYFHNVNFVGFFQYFTVSFSCPFVVCVCTLN